MRSNSLFQDKSKLLRQIIAAWATLGIGVVIFVFLSILGSILTPNKEQAIIFAFLLTAPLLIAAHIYLYARDYHLRKNSQSTTVLENPAVQGYATPTKTQKHSNSGTRADTKHSIRCPHCSSDISADVDRCPVCGTDLNEAMIARATDKIRKNPRDATNYATRGYAYAAKGEYYRALADLDYAIKLDPNLADAYSIRGMKHVEMGNISAALADLSHAIRLSPSDEDAYFYRGMAHTAVNDSKNAFADFEQVTRLNPKRADAYIQRAFLFENRGDTRRAVAEIERALQVVDDPYERMKLEEIVVEVRRFEFAYQKSRQSKWWLTDFLVTILELLASAGAVLGRALKKLRGR